MSTFDRLTNLAKGAVSDGRKRFEDGGGLEGLARRAGDKAREVADAARDAAVAVQDDLSQRTSAGSFASDSTSTLRDDRSWAAAREEVASLRPGPPRTGGTGTGRSTAAPADGPAAHLAALDRRHRSGELDKAAWLAERARLLDELDRSQRLDEKPRRRTL